MQFFSTRITELKFQPGMKISIRNLLNEESHDRQLSAPTVLAALREHKELFVLFQRKTLSASILISHVNDK